VISVKEYCTRHSAYYAVRHPACLGTSWDAVTGARLTVPQPEIYEAVVRASVRGGTGTVAPLGEIVADSPVDPGASRARYGDTEAFWAGPPNGVQRIDWAVHFMAAGAGNWFHWLFELLPRLSYLTLPGPLLVDAHNWEVPQFQEVLRRLTDREVISVGYRAQWDVPNLVMLGRAMWIPPDLLPGVYLEPGDVLISDLAVNYLRQLARPRKSPRRKLWIVRAAKTAPVRLGNEPEVRAFFESHGFTAVSPETMSFEEQVDVFGGARIIAGESGAALANLLWAPASATVVCLRSYAWRANAYADLAGHLGQTWIPCDAQGAPPPSNQSGFLADVAALAEQLRDEL
jgi:capsular polysaccharide biosynthesis protein